MEQFTTNYAEIVEQINNIDPTSYSRSRNFLNGKVTRLSPYLTHGVITLNQIKTTLLAKYKYNQVEKLIFELAWKEYFLRVWESKKDDIWTDIKRPQDSLNNLIPSNLSIAKTGIMAIDNSILDLYQTGYMHNHARMWTASITTNIARCHWKLPSQWMYYHLLDGDLASNTLSWQWVAGTFSSKKYFANQENVNKYAGTRQLGTFLDVSYEDIGYIEIPPQLKELQNLELVCDLKNWVAKYLEVVKANSDLNNIEILKQVQSGGVYLDKKNKTVSKNKNLVLFHPWCLDPTFGSEIDNSDKILLLEPSHFEQYPMSQKRINFILDLAQNIPGINVIVGEVDELDLTKYSRIITKKYPAIEHWLELLNFEIIKPDYMFPTVYGYFGSFMGYWKKCERCL